MKKKNKVIFNNTLIVPLWWTHTEQISFMAAGFNKKHFRVPDFALADLINAVRGTVKQFTEIHRHKTYTTLKVTSVVRIQTKRYHTAATAEPHWPMKGTWSDRSPFRSFPIGLYWANNVLTLNMKCRLEPSSKYPSYFYS